MSPARPNTIRWQDENVYPAQPRRPRPPLSPAVTTFASRPSTTSIERLPQTPSPKAVSPTALPSTATTTAAVLHAQNNIKSRATATMATTTTVELLGRGITRSPSPFPRRHHTNNNTSLAPPPPSPLPPEAAGYRACCSPPSPAAMRLPSSTARRSHQYAAPAEEEAVVGLGVRTPIPWTMRDSIDAVWMKKPSSRSRRGSESRGRAREAKRIGGEPRRKASFRPWDERLEDGVVRDKLKEMERSGSMSSLLFDLEL